VGRHIENRLGRRPARHLGEHVDNPFEILVVNGLIAPYPPECPDLVELHELASHTFHLDSSQFRHAGPLDPWKLEAYRQGGALPGLVYRGRFSTGKGDAKGLHNNICTDPVEPRLFLVEDEIDSTMRGLG